MHFCKKIKYIFFHLTHHRKNKIAGISVKMKKTKMLESIKMHKFSIVPKIDISQTA